jgi:hypothetical protein
VPKQDIKKLTHSHKHGAWANAFSDMVTVNLLDIDISINTKECSESKLLQASILKGVASKLELCVTFRMVFWVEARLVG